MVASIFQTFIVQPIFNLLVFIYAILPGHNFGLALIIFTIVVRFLMWPVVRKQLHQTKAMRKLQPELKKIKAATKGDKQKEAQLMMELYKEKGVSAFGPIGTMIVQLVILIGLYSGLHKVVKDPQALIDNSYGFIHNLSWMKTLAAHPDRFDHTLFGFIDLNRAAWANGKLYFPGLVLVIGSAISQYFQSKQLMPSPEKGRKLRDILKDAGSGKSADQAEINAAVGSTTRIFIPFMIFYFTIGLASALSLYWVVGGLVAYWQQSRALKEDEEEMDDIADAGTVTDGEVLEGEVIPPKKPKATKKKAKAGSGSKAKRRKK